MNLLTTQNAKTIKGVGEGYKTAILYLAPSTIAGEGNVCPFASKGCTEACLYTAGRGKFTRIQEARIRKTKLFFQSPKSFIETLHGDIASFEQTSARKDLMPAIRLNGTSDLPFESLGGNFQKNLMDRFPLIQFYDYTKNPNRMKAYLRGEFPKNYHLTFSRSEKNHKVCEEILALGGNVAMVFDEVPENYASYPVVDGDKNDLRFLDKSNVIVGLKAKGDGKKDKSGFVIQTK